jgi:hypothetical protein
MSPDGRDQRRLTNSPKDGAVCSGSWGRTALALAAPASSLSPEATPGVFPFQLGALAPGKYRDSSFDPPFEFSLGPNWSGDVEAPDGVELSYGTGPRNLRPTIIGSRIRVVYREPCGFGSTRLIGSTARDLVAWLQSYPYVQAADPQPITLGGYSGLVIDISHPDPTPATSCGSKGFLLGGEVWLYPLGGDPGVHMEVGDLARFTIVEVRGQTVVFVFSANQKKFSQVATQMQPFIESLAFPTP